MKNLINENLIPPEILYDFNSVIKKLNLTNTIFSYETFTFGFKLEPNKIYLVLDYIHSGNYLLKILDNNNSALVLKGFKLGKNIANSKMIAPNPFTSIEDNNSIQYFKVIQLNSQDNDFISEQLSFNQSYHHTPMKYPVVNNKRFNHNENIIKTMDKLIEMHFKPSKNISHINSRENIINLNEVISQNNTKSNTPTNHQELLKIQKWRNELYSMLI